ncbi:MAG: AAA domain-containing protein [Sulfuricurvum sp.]|uniref:AAA domain-containing protein n=1 Tax=Sulfuricurvum sp. TaxID=2025608 RepID=UPI0026311EAA|nr:AAA domain-containing protein [Sulfuricurvum sp.]MDD2829800.1 AAA domain-containing protein [Sulfuricurvum sp.]MDD4950291.1 AAA domain-containing protein [Sulfuricurvum sp.]
MDENKYLILLDGKNKTSDIVTIDDSQTNIKIQFSSNDKFYTYSKTKVLIYEYPEVIDPNSCHIYLRDKCLFNITKILDFESYLKIFYGNGKISAYSKDDLRIEHNVLIQKNAKNTFDYLKALAKSLKSEENDFLDKQYEKMSYLSEESVLAKYLNPDVIKKYQKPKIMIFPFGLNLSQEVAVANALTHQVSIIEGPPGTGKTQTILNIIANLLVNDNTVAVVSNNNAAIENVYDKLDALNLSFFAAMLGNKKNQEEFFANQQETYPQVCNMPDNDFLNNRDSLEKNIVHLKEMLQANNDLAKASQELEALKIEKRHFMNMFAARAIDIGSHEDFFSKQSLDNTLSLWAELESLVLHDKKITFFFKIKALFKYKIFSFSLYQYPLDEIILVLQKCFYEIKEKKLIETIFTLKNLLKDENFETILKAYTTDSMALLELHLSKKYNLTEKKQQFEKDALWKNFEDFTREYPVVLSTTHSLRNCTQENFLYDYLIIDEASQVDVIAGGLALSCAKNVVIVGDLKQLPHIVGKDIENVVDDTFKDYALATSYHYKNSLLASALKVFDDAPKTLLKEHYRCHPKIIDFCNKKFYHDELVILSKEGDAGAPLILVNTAEGNHARGKSNQRQIDVIKNEILPRLSTKSLGVISPFRDQVNKLSSEITQELSIEIDTVHKYQGREKDIIIITTVVDEENEFADDPNLLNVAVSRAKEQLYIVVSDREKNKNMKDLVNYIRYNNFEIADSKIYSIFDLLYQDYAPYLKRFLGKIKKVSNYQSENLMNVIIEKVLDLEQYSNLAYNINYPLNKLIKDTSILNADELAFVKASSHIDFLIHNKISKQPVLAIEVDGFAFHTNNPVQLERDALKDRILDKYSIPIIRFSTDGSEEETKLRKKLREVITL